jgi:hypothetical protein
MLPRRIAHLLVLAVVATAVGAVPLRADDDPDVRAGEFSINYQFASLHANGASENLGFGVSASHVLNFTPRYGLVGDFGYSYKSEDTGDYGLNYSTFEAGLARRDSMGTLRLMVGIARTSVESVTTGTSLGAVNKPVLSVHYQSAPGAGKGNGFSFGLGGGAILTEGATTYFWRLTAGWSWKTGESIGSGPGK